MKASTDRKRKMRVGAVSYLNTKPLIHRFADFAPDAELVLDVPSRLADRLAAGELDVALIPSIEVFQNPEYVIVSDACIACRGPVLSVKLLSRTAISKIQTLALDAGSRTSVALVQILLQQRHGVRPRLRSLPLGAPCALEDVFGNEDVDAVLLIGDRAIHAADYEHCDQWDLGQQWCEWTGLPFVFAMWTARPGFDARELERALSRSRDAGIAELDTISATAARDVELDEQTCLTYLRDNLHFVLGEQEQQGLALFIRHAQQLGFVAAENMPSTMGTIQ